MASERDVTSREGFRKYQAAWFFVGQTVNVVRVKCISALFAIHVMGLFAAVFVSEISWEVT
jgi:hypothetical protein